MLSVGFNLLLSTTISFYQLSLASIDFTGFVSAGFDSHPNTQLQFYAHCHMHLTFKLFSDTDWKTILMYFELSENLNTRWACLVTDIWNKNAQCSQSTVVTCITTTICQKLTRNTYTKWTEHSVWIQLLTFCFLCTCWSGSVLWNEFGKSSLSSTATSTYRNRMHRK